MSIHTLCTTRRNFLLTPSYRQARVDAMRTEPTQEVMDQWREDRRNRNAEQELRDTIVAAIWHAANRSLGAMEIATICGNDCCAPGETVPAFDLQTWKAQRADGTLQKRLHLEAIRMAMLVGQDPRGWVVNAKVVVGASWSEIGDVLGTTRQAAQQRFREHVESVVEGSDYYQEKAREMLRTKGIDL